VLVTRTGGAKGYRAFRPFCLGLILGEAFAFVLWAGVPLGRLLMGEEAGEALKKLEIM
jgi:hypothetical protein